MADTYVTATVADRDLSVSFDKKANEADTDDPREKGRKKKRALFRRLKNNVTADLRHSSQWRKDARDNYDQQNPILRR